MSDRNVRIVTPAGTAPSAAAVADPSLEIEKLSQDLGEAYEQLTLIYRTVRHLGASFELATIARQLVDHAREAIPTDLAGLYLRDLASGLSAVASHGDVAAILPPESLERLATLTRPTFYSGDAARELQCGEGIRHNLLVAPLDVGGRSLGLLVLLRDGQDGPDGMNRFTTVESKLVGALCNVTAVAVANWQHYRAILNEREMLEGVIREIDDGIVIADASWKARRTNRAARDFLAIAEGAEGYDVLEQLRAFRLSREESDLRGAAAEAPEFRAEFLDARRPLVLACHVFQAHFGAAAEPILVVRMRDATREHREAEAQRDFISLASHKLRTPLTKILGLLPIAADETVASELKHESLAGIESGAGELAHLIDGVLEFVEFRRGDHVVEWLDLRVLAEAAIAAVKRSRPAGAEAALTCPAPSPRVLGSRRMLAAMFENLVDNAVKFSPAGGPPVEVHVAREGVDRVKIAVRDHGDGIAPELARRLFLPFSQRDAGFTGQDEGAGLGLLLARQAAIRHGGSLEVESSLGNGSCFLASIGVRGFERSAP